MINKLIRTNSPNGLPWWLRDKEASCSAGAMSSIPGSKLTTVFLPGESCGQRSLVGYTVHRVTKSQTRPKRFRTRRTFESVLWVQLSQLDYELLEDRSYIWFISISHGLTHNGSPMNMLWMNSWMNKMALARACPWVKYRRIILLGLFKGGAVVFSEFLRGLTWKGLWLGMTDLGPRIEAHGSKWNWA